MASSKPTYTTEFPAATTIGVMAKLKRANQTIDMLFKQINETMELIEQAIIADPKNVALHHLLLKTAEIHHKKKCIANYDEPQTIYNEETGEEKPVLDKSGKQVVKRQSLEEYIRDNDRWRVQLIAKGTAVRITITPEHANKIKQIYKHYQNLKVWE